MSLARKAALERSRSWKSIGRPFARFILLASGGPTVSAMQESQGVVDDEGKEGPYANVNMLIPVLDTLELRNELIQLK